MLYIMIFFSILAGIDKMFNNKYRLGVKFEEGFKSMGGMALSIIGIYTLSPVIGRWLIPILNPLAQIIRTDPSVFIGSILATDLGGYLTSIEISNSVKIGEFNGLILASMLGTTISFTIPVALTMIDTDSIKYFSKGILAGIVTIPLGMVASGIMMGITWLDLLTSIFPVILFSIIIVIGLLKFFDKILKVFNFIGKSILLLSTFGLLLSILDFMFGIKIIQGMLPFEEAVVLVGKIAIILSGAYPMLYYISIKLQRQFKKLSIRFGLDEYSIMGLISSTVNNVPMIGVYDKMNWKGQILNAAFAVSGAFVFGGQLGYITTVSPANVNPFIVGKLIGGITAILLAIVIIKVEMKKEGEKVHES